MFFKTEFDFFIRRGKVGISNFTRSSCILDGLEYEAQGPLSTISYYERLQIVIFGYHKVFLSIFLSFSSDSSSILESYFATTTKVIYSFHFRIPCGTIKGGLLSPLHKPINKGKPLLDQKVRPLLLSGV